ncbi:MAG: hypothetical protein PHR06_01625 [Candidatus Cloacimonetes bacterium]|nr:hypothetical protein [Candidatus Cloacimonadota bacterium]
MFYLIRDISIPIEKNYNLKKLTAAKCNISQNEILSLHLVRRAIDARKKNNLKYNFTCIIETGVTLILDANISIYDEENNPETETTFLNDRHPFIIGAGPAGYFSALALVEKGFKPIIFEQGDCLENRAFEVSKFWKTGVLNEKSNIQFGEGGAGAFSDGKLTARNRNFYSGKVFDYLIQFGANPEIGYEALPHLGTEIIRQIFGKIRKYLLDKGCQIHWQHELTDFELSNDKITRVVINNEIYKPEVVIMAIGNSARSLFRKFKEKEILIESKPFAVGFRIEHPQQFINAAFYGDNTDFSLTGPATYRLTARAGSKGIYSFCMCPGGFVISAASEHDGQVTNGMSFQARGNKFANSAIVVTVDKNDFGNNELHGVDFQQTLEKIIFSRSKDFSIPAQNAKDYLLDRETQKQFLCSDLCKIKQHNLNGILPKQIENSIKTGLKYFDKRVPGFLEQGNLFAVETRTSSPVKIIRDNRYFHSKNVKNLYVVGEGSGYSGGIISSAADGYRIGSCFRLDNNRNHNNL